MELSQLKYFMTVAQTGKISAAAQALYLSAPALSASISRLEKELGAPLFDRSGNSITLNRQGQIFLRYTQQVFTALDCAQVELRQSLLEQEGSVSIATLLSNLWVDLLTEFWQTHKDVPLSTAVLRPIQLEQGGIPPQYTFLLAEEGEVPEHFAAELQSTLLFQDQPAIMVHPSHALAKEASVTLEMLDGENLFLPVEGMSLSKLLTCQLQRKGLQLPQGTCSPYLVYHHMVEQGLGISFTTVHSGTYVHPTLACVPISDFGTCWTMRLFWRKNKPLTSNEKLFLSFAQNHYK